MAVLYGCGPTRRTMRSCNLQLEIYHKTERGLKGVGEKSPCLCQRL